MNLWLEVVQLASTIVFSDDEDTISMLQFASPTLMEYIPQSLYKIVNFRGIVPVHVPAVNLALENSSQDTLLSLAPFQK